MKKNLKAISAIKFIVPILFLFLLVFDIQCGFTDFPKIVIHIQEGSTAHALYEASSIYDIFGDWNTFAYFTTLSNILFVLTFVASWTLRIKVSKYWINAVMIYLLITFTIFWAAISPYMPWGQNHYYDFISIHEHFVVILAGGVFWFFSKGEKLSIKRQFGISMIFPLLYLLFALIIYGVWKVGIYPFLDLMNYFSLNLDIGVSIFISIMTIIAIGIVIFLLSACLADFSKVKIKTMNFFAKMMLWKS